MANSQQNHTEIQQNQHLPTVVHNYFHPTNITTQGLQRFLADTIYYSLVVAVITILSQVM